MVGRRTYRYFGVFINVLLVGVIVGEEIENGVGK